MTSTATRTADAPRDLDEAREQADAIAAAAEPGISSPPEPDAKPKRTRTRKPRPSRARTDRAPRATKPRAAALRVQLEEAITGVGLLVFVVNQPDGQLIMAGAARQAAALDALAKENPAVRAALERLLRTSVYAGLAMAFAPTLLGIAANHNLVPPIVGAIAGMANSSTPAGSTAGKPEAADPLAGVDLTNLAAMFAPTPAAPTPDATEGSEGVPYGVVAGANAVG